MNDVFFGTNNIKKEINDKNYTALRISLTSPDDIRDHSNGEVKKPETINYRTHKPEPDGLFCAKIFGPVKDYTCLCGKYKKRKYEGLTCEKCGVKITSSSVRRSWIGHIELASPVIHPWFFRSPSRIGYLLNYTHVEMSKLLFEDFYAVVSPGFTGLYRDDVMKEGLIITEEAYQLLTDTLPQIFLNIPEEKLSSIKSRKLYVVTKGNDEFKECSLITLEQFMENRSIGAETGETALNFLKEKLGDFSKSRKYFNAIVDNFCELEGKEYLYDADFSHLPSNFINPSYLVDLLFGEVYCVTNVHSGKKIEDISLPAVGDWLNKDEYLALIGETKLFEAETGFSMLKKFFDTFSADRGAESLGALLKKIDLKSLSDILRIQLKKETSETKKKKYSQRLKIVEAFYISENKAEWMILNVIPVLPPDLRPLVPLEGGRFATSDLNDLYRRIITRNNRLKKLIDIGAPSIIIRNEKRMLQEAVDALFDNSSMTKPAKSNNGRPLKSLTESLKGKQGRFRQHLLGKRVDYSGRSVITIGPDLKLHQCGLPKKMALELFKPFIFNKLIERGLVTNVKSAKKKVEDQEEVVFEVLEDIVKEHPILLNRAPTLHRLGIQAFEPILVESKSIQLHPLVCVAFNADFDGDQMAVHLPLSIEAQIEARVLMMSTNNILSPASGKPIISPHQDIVLGLYYITRERYFRKGGGWLPDIPNLDSKESEDSGLTAKDALKSLGVEVDLKKIGKKDFSFSSLKEAYCVYKLSQQNRFGFDKISEDSLISILVDGKKPLFSPAQLELALFRENGGMIFSSPEEAVMALEYHKVDIHAKVKVRIDGKLEDTTPGRILFWQITPKKSDTEFDGRGLRFMDINKVLGKKEITKLLHKCFIEVGPKATVIFADKIKDLGFRQATLSGISVNINDMIIPEAKKSILEEAQRKIEEFDEQVANELLSEDEKINRVKELWEKTTERVSNAITKYISKVTVSTKDKHGFLVTKEEDSLNPIYIMKDSGARGSDSQIKQVSGMRGLMTKPNGDIIPTPIKANFREGLSVSEYFISTHGARKGLSDTALKTASSGYLTRKLVDVAHDAIVTSYDCGTIVGLEVDIDEIEGKNNAEKQELFIDRILGRTALDDVVSFDGRVIVSKGEEISERVIDDILESGIETVRIRSVLTCKSRKGVCRKCYGRDLARGEQVNIGEAIGVIAAQSIGEPGTQLTMRVFHQGGVASGSASELEYQSKVEGRVVFDRISTIKDKDGIDVVVTRNGNLRLIDKNGREKEVINVEYGSKIFVKDAQDVLKGSKILQKDPHSKVIISEVTGIVKFIDLVQDVTFKEEVSQSKAKTGHESTIRRIIEHKGKKEFKPAIAIVDEFGQPITVRTSKDREEIAVYHLTKDFGIAASLRDGQKIEAGTVLASKTKTQRKNEDIVAGLPRVEELFEARKPKDTALVSEIDGIVEFGTATKTKVRIKIKPEVGKEKQYEIPRTKETVVKDGDYIRAGERITEGDINPHDILKIKGEKELSKFLVKEIQKVYRSQGVAINDKHIEVIVRQMLKKVQIIHAGDSVFLSEENIDRFRFEDEKMKLLKLRKRPATAKPLLLGISRAALTTESFISAASFQETTKVLTEAAIHGKIDYLMGLKENVIMGRLIPAGTGIQNYSKLEMEVVRSEDEIL